MGNQTVGCRNNPCQCPDGKICDRNAQCIHIGRNQYTCKCKVGWTGDGFVCGPDRDLDGSPDYDLECSDIKCRKVRYKI